MRSASGRLRAERLVAALWRRQEETRFRPVRTSPEVAASPMPSYERIAVGSLLGEDACPTTGFRSRKNAAKRVRVRKKSGFGLGWHAWRYVASSSVEWAAVIAPSVCQVGGQSTTERFA